MAWHIIHFSYFSFVSKQWHRFIAHYFKYDLPFLKKEKKTTKWQTKLYFLRCKLRFLVLFLRIDMNCDKLMCPICQINREQLSSSAKMTCTIECHHQINIQFVRNIHQFFRIFFLFVFNRTEWLRNEGSPGCKIEKLELTNLKNLSRYDYKDFAIRF